MEDTFFASAERLDKEEIIQSYHEAFKSPNIRELLDAFPYIAGIVNAERQFVYANQVLLGILGLPGLDSILGRRPGEVISCIHANETPGGCGTSADCQYCGAVNAILDSQESGQKVKHETRITAHDGEEMTSFDLNVIASPVYIGEKIYTLLVLEDISNDKRRRALERIFFHDVLNKAGSMDGLLEIIRESDDPKEVERILSVVQRVSHDMVSEIQFQREIAAAETGEVTLNPQVVHLKEFLSTLATQMKHHEVARGKDVKTMVYDLIDEIIIDPTILNRILTNMVKNALEAEQEGSVIKVKLYRDGSSIIFAVHNPKVMPPEVKSQVFQRSFSTKGSNRGLGTYSIKLLGEKFLNGKVYFTSEEETGTQFFLELPG
jgi:signal transduction histidine kinase